MGNLKCIAGDDGYLFYYYKCGDCNTIVIEDDHWPHPDINNFDCPICNPNQKKFPFEYVTSDKLDEYKLPAPVIDKDGKITKGEISLRQRLELKFLE